MPIEVGVRAQARRAIDVDDMRRLARRRLPPMVFDAFDGGAEDEVTLRANREAYAQLRLRPRSLVDVSTRDAAVELFGDRLTMPVVLAPTGSARLADSRAELVIARAARAAGTIYVHSAVASYSLEDVAQSGPLWFQMYLPSDRGRARTLIDRVAAAGYRALVLTIDTSVRGNRVRDERNRFSLPYRVTPHLIMQGLSRPAWSAEFVAGNLRPEARQAAQRKARDGRASLRQVEQAIIGARWPATWEDLDWVRSVWTGPLLIKGLPRAEECEEMIARGVDGFIVSNHGGRQLDGAPPTIEVLPEIVEAVSGRAVVLVDGGIRRGSDVLKAVALGATACLVGRPYLYGLAAGGEPGLTRVMDIFRTEIDRTMALLGVTSLEELDGSFVMRSADLTVA